MLAGFAGVAGVLENAASVGGGATLNINALVALLGDDLEPAAAESFELPRLVVAVVAGPLVEFRSVCGRSVGEVEAFVALLGADAPVSSAEVVEGELAVDVRG